MWYDDRYCVLYILVLVLLTLALIQGHRSVRMQNLLRQLSYKLFSLIEWNLVYFETCWYEEPHSHFILSIQYSKDDFVKKNF